MISKMSLKSRRLIVCALALALAVMTAACGNSSSESGAGDSGELKEVTFCLDWTPNTNHTGLYVAIDKGYFEEAGLSVVVVQPPEDGAASLVGAGKAEFGVDFQDTMAPALIGDAALPITAVGAVLQHNTSGIISLKEKGIDSPGKMEGHSYATWDSPVELATLEQVVEADGGDFSKVEMIPSTVTDEVTAFQQDSVDSIWIFDGWAGVACRLAGLDTNYFNFRDIDDVFDYYTPVIISNDEFLASDPDTAKAFMDALSRGYTYAAENPDEAADILIAANPELADSEELVRESQKYLSEYYIDDASQWGVIDPARWNAFYNWLGDNGLVEEPIPENTGFTNDYLPAAE